MSVLDRKLRRDLWSHLWLLLAITSIIGVGVACYVSMGTNYRNLQEAKLRYYAQCRMADFSIELKKAPLAALAELAELDGVVEIRPRIQFFATVDLDAVPEPINALVLSLPDARKPVINDIVLMRGSYFTDRRENEVIISEAFAARHGLGPGDWIHVVLNNRRQELLIVGSAISSEFVYALGPGAIIPDPEHFGIFFLKQSYAEDVYDFDGAANQVVGLMTPGVRERPDELLRRAETLLVPYGVFSTTPRRDQPSNRFLTQEIDGLRTFAVVMPLIFLGVAAAVLNVLLSRLAEQQRTTIGTLKALGYTDAQVFGHFLKFGLAMGVVGGLVGCVLGYGLGGFMTAIYRQFYEFPALDNRFYPNIHFFGLAISLACAIVGSLRGARVVLRLRPAEAMRAKPPRAGGAVLAERINWFWSRLGSGWRMVIRSVSRSHMRTAAAAFAAMMGAAVLSAGFMMAQAMPYLIDFQFKWITRSDIDLGLKDERSMAALLEAARLPGVDRAEPLLSVACTFVNGPYRKKGVIQGILPNAQLTVPRDIDGRPIRIPRGGLVMSAKLAEILHLRRGDTVVFEPVKGRRDRCEAVVLEIAESYVGTSVYADIELLSRMVHEEFAVNGLQLATDGHRDNQAALYRELKHLPAVESVTARADMVANLEKTLVQNMMGFIVLLVLFAGVIFFGSILTASLISLAERQREVATLRVLGYGPWWIGSLLLRETMIVTLLGTALGMPLGYFLTVLTAVSYDTELFRFPVVSTPATWIATTLLAVAFALIAHLFVQRAIHRMNWLEALQAKE